MQSESVSPIPQIGFVRLRAILDHYPVSKSTWWNMVRDGRAPKPVKLGPMTTAWVAQEIRAFLQDADTRGPA